MKKKAILVKGKPIIIDDLDEFRSNSKRNLNLMAEIALTEGYEIQYASLEGMVKSIRASIDSDEFLFYFTGHANKDHIGTLNYKTNSILGEMKKISGKKLIILDACTGDYKGGQHFEALDVPRNSTIVSAREVYDNKSLAKILYDAVILRKNKLEDIDKNTFDSMEHNWVYFMKKIIDKFNKLFLFFLFMPEIDYKKLQFKSGLEIHQQLDSFKLFCNCPSILRSDRPDFEVKRKLHAVAGESGKVDIAAKHQAELDKEFIYQGYYDNTCLVELDEEPPYEINKEALKIAIQISLLMNMKIVPITQIMRKTVVDGSNTSGFQRTVLVAMNGFLETSQGKVKIESLFLEEDAARVVERTDKREIYKLDRLGIPLVEVVTAPDIRDAQHAKEVALQIGDILRSCKVRRGIGTIRQDVNISIRGENRVEMKGMQNMNLFIKAIEKEVLRQKKLSDEKKPTPPEVRTVLPDASSKFMRPLPGSARMYPETDLPLLKISKKVVDEAKKDLPKLKKDLEKEFHNLGLNQEMVKLLFKQDKFKEFKALLKIVNKPVLIAKTLLMYPKEIAARTNKDLKDVEKILDAYFDSILLDVKKGKLSEENIKLALEKLIKGEKFEETNIDISRVEEEIIKIIKEKPGLSDKAYMGLIMSKFKGKISGKEVMEVIKKYLK